MSNTLLLKRCNELLAENAALKEQLVEAQKDADRWRLASTSRNFGITNWCEFGQRTSYGEFAEKLIDAAIAQQAEKIRELERG